MSCRHRITVCCAVLALALVACGSKKELARAKRSVYDSDFAVVYSKALEATRELYPNLDDNPGTGAIKTAWHQVSYANNQDDLSGGRTLSTQPGGSRQLASSPGMAQAGMPTRLAYKRFFIRFDVSVIGGRPWRVKIVGHASEWEPGAALPTELVGPAKPPWLDGRTDALTLAIYKKMKSLAVPMKEEEPKARPEDQLPKTDPKLFAQLPAAAAKRLAELRDAVVRRDYPSLRAQLFDDVQWSLGGSPDAETAMALWQADPEPLDAMAKLIGDKCVATETQVKCPGGDPVVGQWQLVLQLRGADWKVASFFRSE